MLIIIIFFKCTILINVSWGMEFFWLLISLLAETSLSARILEHLVTIFLRVSCEPRLTN